ncbi:MAG TPA: hypothetical protein VGI39_04215 [Polyangiaceae bacterium]|jgi:hypothetical protein
MPEDQLLLDALPAFTERFLERVCVHLGEPVMKTLGFEVGAAVRCQEMCREPLVDRRRRLGEPLVAVIDFVAHAKRLEASRWCSQRI